jgi:hypothetical protein
MAALVRSGATFFEGNDQTLPSGMAPSPQAERPSTPSTRARTASTVAWVVGTPPNLRGVRYA